MTSVYRLLFVLLFALPLPAAAQTLAMSGTISYAISGSTVVLGIDRIDYTCPVGVTGRSGTLRVSLWASATPYTGVAQPGYMLAEYTVGELGCNQFFSGVSSGSITFAPPPDGTWHMTMMLEEFDGIYYVVDYLAFDRTEAFGGQSVLTAVEYYHAVFGHYFVTAIPGEIATLDAGIIPGWTRTGESFGVYALGTPNTQSVCRFLSAIFAPRSSHFYTPYAVECQGLKAGTDWQFEGDVYAVSLAYDLAGNCPFGLKPLFRLYNEGISGAPNHRYTTSTTIRQIMRNAGWTSEGVGALGVVACVP
jgi:hypothetical protein